MPGTSPGMTSLWSDRLLIRHVEPAARSAYVIALPHKERGSTLQMPLRIDRGHPLGYSVTVCTTLLTGRVLATGSFVSLIMASSYSASVCTGALALI
jgi:hypothetical protein